MKNNKGISTYPIVECSKNWLGSKEYNVNIHEEVKKKVDNVRNPIKLVKKLEKLEIVFEQAMSVPGLNENVKKQMNEALGVTTELQETGMVQQKLDLIMNESTELEKMVKDILADHKQKSNTGDGNPSCTKVVKKT